MLDKSVLVEIKNSRKYAGFQLDRLHISMTSLFLFLLVIDYGLRKVERGGFGINFSGEKLFHFDFSDDVALTAGDKREL